MERGTRNHRSSRNRRWADVECLGVGQRGTAPTRTLQFARAPQRRWSVLRGGAADEASTNSARVSFPTNVDAMALLLGYERAGAWNGARAICDARADTVVTV